MVRVLLGAIVGGVVVFAWGAIAHMLLPLGEMGLKTLANEQPVLAAMKKSIPDPGMYIFPGADMSKKMSAEEEKAWQAKYMAGPAGLLVLRAPGEQPVSPKKLLTELGTNIVSALLAAILLTQIPGRYLQRVLAVMLLGLFGALITNVPYWNWYGFPADFTIAAVIEHTAGWLLGGLALAAIVKPCSCTATPAAATPKTTNLS